MINRNRPEIRTTSGDGEQTAPPTFEVSRPPTMDRPSRPTFGVSGLRPGGEIITRRDPYNEPTRGTERETDDDDGSSDPFNRLADAFMGALGGNSTPKDTTPYVVVDPNYSEGSGMNWKGIAVVVLVGVGIWFAWKKWGGKVTAAAGGE